MYKYFVFSLLCSVCLAQDTHIIDDQDTSFTFNTPAWFEEVFPKPDTDNTSILDNWNNLKNLYVNHNNTLYFNTNSNGDMYATFEDLNPCNHGFPCPNNSTQTWEILTIKHIKPASI